MATVLPTVHINGTSKSALCSTYDAAAQSLARFITDWNNIEFNPRDYYVNSDSTASAERDSMASKIREVRDYLESVREHLYQ